jgi:drug/metabolite transporter (DMT)-like permease
MNPGILLALGSALAYGGSDFVGGIGARRHSSWQVVFIGQASGALVMLLAGIIVPGRPLPLDFAWTTLAGVGSAIGSIFLLRGFSRGQMGLVAPISAVGAAILPALVGAIFGERPGGLVWIGIAVALLGTWLVCRQPLPQRRAGMRGALVDGVVAGVGFGVLFVAIAQVSDGAGALPLAANQLVGAIVTVVVATALGKAWLPSVGVLGWGGASGVLGAIGSLAFLIASGATGLAMAGVLASLYPAVTVVLAAGVLRERVSAGQLAGVGICTLAVAAIALG